MDVAEIEAQIDPRRALAALHYPQTSEPQRVKGGWDTLLWRFQTPDGGDHSLRIHVLPRREDTARRERLALQACAPAGLPAPRLEAAGRVDGLPAMVLSWCPGVPILSLVERRPWTLWRLGRLFGEVQARVHALAPPAELAATAPEDWLSLVTEEDADLAAHARSLGLSTSSLIHMDFHPLNVLSDGRGVTGVLDWSCAAAGDPRADLARTEAILRAAPAPPGPTRPLLNLARNLILRAWRSGYRQAAGSLPDYRPMLAWAGASFLVGADLHVDRAGVWATPEEIERFRRLIRAWAREAGIR